MQPNLLEVLKARAGRPTNDLVSLLWARKLGGYPIDTIIGIPPLSFKSDGTPLTSVTIKGNGQQNGTPSPQSIIMPTFCGVRTGNLFDSAVYELIPVSASVQRKGTNLGVLPQGTYTFNAVSATSATPIYRTIKSGSTYTFEAITSLPYTFTADGVSEQIIRTSGIQGNTWEDAGYSSIMLNAGTEPLPYEPYGYKLPLTCASTTTPIYLGQTPTVRRIKKLVLTGEENWKKSTIYHGSFYAACTDGVAGMNVSPAFCTHAVKTRIIDAQNYTYGKFAFDGRNGLNLNLFIGEAAWSEDDFKAYLTQQYQNGTPVTVWYVLAEPETGIVNEPLYKIGDYCDELTTTTPIPTAKGSNTLSVDTTVQPSEVAIRGHIKSN